MAKKQDYTNPASIKYGLDPEQGEFVQLVLAHIPEIEAYKRAFKGATKLIEPQLKNALKEMKKDSPHVFTYIDYMKNTSPKELAQQLNEAQMVFGTEVQAAKAADRIIEREDAATAEKSTKTWLRVMQKCGAKIVVHPSMEERVFDFADLLEGRAHLRLPKEAKWKLCEMAGAPWNNEVANCQLSDIQKRFLAREDRTLVLSAGSRLGKSALGACVALCELALPNRRIAIIGSEYQYALNEFEYLYPAFEKLFGWGCAVKHGYANQGNYYKGFIETLWGSSVHIYSLKDDNGASLLGKEYDLAIIGEAGRVNTEAIDRNLIRGLAGRTKVDARTGYSRKTGRMTLFSTPKGFEGIMSDTIDRAEKRTNRRADLLRFPEGKASWEESVYIEFASVLENPTYSKKEFEAQKAILPETDFREQFMGERIFRSGLVYQEFVPEKHVVPFPPKEKLVEMRLGLGLDTGSNTGVVIMGLDREGCIWQLGELATKDVIIFESLKQAEWMCNDIGIDINRLDVFQVDVNSQEKLALQQMTPYPWSFQKYEVRGTIDHLHSMMKAGKFKVTENCPRTIEQISRYRWNGETSGSGRDTDVIKKDDHLLDAGRYCAMMLLDLGPTFAQPKNLNYEEWVKKATEEMWKDVPDDTTWSEHY